MGKQSKDRRDIFYRKAKEEGYRARSAYKLIQLNEKFGFFNAHTHRVLDLCAAPGSWSQVARYELDKVEQNRHQDQDVSAHKSILVAVDIQEMAPIDGVHIIIGDITRTETHQEIISAFHGEMADLVLSDGAPDITGLHDLDEYTQDQLLLSSLTCATQVLAPGGIFVAKIFRGENIPFVYSQLDLLFERVYCCKPESSRNSSLEAFVVCTNFGYGTPTLNHFFRSNFSRFIGQYPSIQSSHNNTSSTLDDHTLDYLKMAIPFVACGDLSGFDSNRTYELDPKHKFIQPIQPPIDPHYIIPRTYNLDPE